MRPEQTCFYLDSNDCLNLRENGNYEWQVRRVFEDIVKPGDVIVDAGAHIGWHTLLLSRLVGEEGKVFAFEPDPENFAVLEKNAEVNEIDNITLENKAISNANGSVLLHLSEENTGDHRIYSSESHRESIIVETVRLDDYFGPKEIDLVKMDIQGAEVEALFGMKSLFEYETLKLVIEFWPYGIRRSGFVPDEFIDLLRDYKFRLFDISNKQAINRRVLLQIYDTFRGSPGKVYFTNLFCTRQKVMLRWPPYEENWWVKKEQPYGIMELFQDDNERRT